MSLSRHFPLGVLAQNKGAGDAGGGGGAPGTGWTLSPTKIRTGFTLSDGNRTATNDNGPGNWQGYVESVQAFQVVDQVYYWEFECTSDDGGGVAVGCGAFLTDTKIFGNDQNDDVSQLRDQNWMYSQGLFVTSSGVSTSSASFGGLVSGDIGMICFNPATGEIWLGENGVWEDDPDVDAASYTLGTPAELGQWYRLALQAPESGAGVKLITDTGELTYSIPAAAVAIDGVGQTDVALVDQSMIYTVTEG